MRSELSEFCGCGRSRRDDARYVGPQETSTPGEWLLIGNCLSCTTTLTIAVVSDACKCSGCGHLILGDHGDHKTLREVGDGPWEILCVECAGKAMPPARPPSFLLRRMGVDVGMY